MTMGTEADWLLPPEFVAATHWHMRDYHGVQKAYYLVKEAIHG